MLKVKTHSLIKGFDKHNSIYNDSYFKGIETYAVQSSKIIANSILELFSPKSIVDLGCGTGDLLNEFQKLQVKSFGIDYSESALYLCKQKGLSVLKIDLENETVPNHIKSDVALCTEVAEHLPESCSDNLIKNLCGISKIIIFTAAPPGQGDVEHHDHVNEQLPIYWVNKFKDFGYSLDLDKTRILQKTWEINNVSSFYYQNLMVFLMN